MKERIMKYLKKIFTLLLVFTITINSLSSLSETYTCKEDVNYNEEIEFLSPFPDRVLITSSKY